MNRVWPSDTLVVRLVGEALGVSVEVRKDVFHLLACGVSFHYARTMLIRPVLMARSNLWLAIVVIVIELYYSASNDFF